MQPQRLLILLECWISYKNQMYMVWQCQVWIYFGFGKDSQRELPTFFNFVIQHFLLIQHFIYIFDSFLSLVMDTSGERYSLKFLWFLLFILVWVDFFPHWILICVFIFKQRSNTLSVTHCFSIVYLFLFETGVYTCY